MRISVIIPAYNAVAYIERAIQSVLAQTRPAEEIIIINDGSTDNTAKVLQRYEGQIRIIHQSNAGVSAARNAGIRAATGDWIAFLDADDEWLPEKLQLQSELLIRHPTLCWVTGNFLFCRCRQNHLQSPALSEKQIPDFKRRMGETDYFDSYFQACQRDAAGNTNTMLVRKDKLLEAGLFPEGQTRIEDDDLWLRLAYLDLKVGYVSEPVAVYHTEVTNSATQQTPNPAYIDLFLSRHLCLASQTGHLALFRRCAKYKLGFWIYTLLTNNQGRAVRELLKKYGDLLSPYTRWTSYIGSLCPGLWRWNEKRKHPELE
jgi:glycosyltransferase involved in cell wall biosynthesis